ncbi:MAG: hypothetical protein BAJATHORv1_20040 [Candidatus Thorarchaeota archaeon]|nr:MAG: hypothetical protein BAJATHORv1_20040 [Candidatus Thorarchaeota archaeon]
MTNVYGTIPDKEIEERTKNLAHHLRENRLDAALLLSMQEIYYYSGIGLEGAVYITSDGNSTYLVKRNTALAKSYSPINDIRDYGRQSKMFQELEVPSESRIGIEDDIVPYSFLQYLKTKAAPSELYGASHIFRNIRAVKSPFEISQIQSAAELIDEMMQYCATIVKPDMSEIELVSHLDSWLLNNGHAGAITTRGFNSGMLHYSYVVSSDSSSLNSFFTPVSGQGLSLKYPYGPTRRKLGRNKPFIVDACGNSNGYISDTTRTFVCGRLGSNKDLLDTLVTIKDFLLEELVPGCDLGVLFSDIWKLADELGVSEMFMGTTDNHVAFIGHGVGLELDEFPILHAKGPTLESGNIIACEPKLVVPMQLVLGLEDTYHISESGPQLLTHAPDYFEV